MAVARARPRLQASGARAVPRLVYATAVDWQRHSAQVEALRERFASLKVQLLSSGVLPLPRTAGACCAPDQPASGCYAPPREVAGTWRAWRLAASLAAALLVLHVAAQALEFRNLRAAERRSTPRSARRCKASPPVSAMAPTSAAAWRADRRSECWREPARQPARHADLPRTGAPEFAFDTASRR